MNYINERPLRQASFDLTCKEDDLVISQKDLKAGILYSQSGMPSFQQDGLPRIETIEKNYGTKAEPRICKFTIYKYRGHLAGADIGVPIYCPYCLNELVDNGTVSCSLTHLPIGSDYSKIIVDRRRVRCLNPECNCKENTGSFYNYTYPVEFKAAKHLMTVSLYNFIIDLLTYGLTLKAVSHLTGVHKNIVKDIHKTILEERYTVDKTNDSGKEFKKPEEYAEYIAVDEFKLHDGYKFATVIIDLSNGHIIHLTEGKKKEAVYSFMDRVGTDWMAHVKAVACDMNSDYFEAFQERYPTIDIVYDHFHIVKNFNEKVITKVRIDEENRLKNEGRIEEAKSLKGSKYILMTSYDKLEETDNKYKLKKRYDKLINENKLFFTIDIIKTSLDKAYTCSSKEEMCKQIKNIVSICRDTNNKHFEWFAKLLESHIEGIVSHATHKIATGKLEGTNNMIKTVRRQGYGYPDDYYFFLRLYDASRKKDHY